LRHHFPNGQTIGTFVISHHLTGLQNGFFIRHSVPRTLVNFLLEEFSRQIGGHHGRNFRRDPSLGGMIAGFKLGLAGKAQGTKLFVAPMGIERGIAAR
jgi:hypothetical protein